MQRLKDELAMSTGQEYTGELTEDELDRCRLYFCSQSSFRLAFIHVPSGGFDVMKLANCFPLDCAEW